MKFCNLYIFSATQVIATILVVENDVDLNLRKSLNIFLYISAYKTKKIKSKEAKLIF